MNNNLMKAYETDASRFKGKALDVVLPTTISEVMRVVTSNNRIVPRGAGTGLAGGVVPQNGLDVVLDLSKLIGIRNFDKDRMTVEVEAGVILDDLQSFVGKNGLEFPVNPMSHSVATIGGMVATDALDGRVAKYGKTSHWVKWIEIIDCNGILHRKGATELSDYAGMEGTTGVIVKVCLKLLPKKRRTASLVKADSIEKIVSVVRNLKRDVGVSMIDFLDRRISEGLGLEPVYHLIVEYEDDCGLIKGEDYEKLLELKDKIYSFVVGEGYIRIEDFKVLIDRFDKLMVWFEKNSIPIFGHLSVGILHPCFNHDQESLIPEMMKLVKRLGGRINGEYGIGILKRGFVEINDQKILRNVKKRCDPLNKFNVGKVI